MAAPLEPLQLNEVGEYGQLSARPNPNEYVVLTVPDFDKMLPFIIQKKGRPLSEEEIEAERQTAPSIVLTREQAQKMKAGRAKSQY